MVEMYKNGFGVSIIDDGYGSQDGLYELAVITDDGIHYNNKVANGDVVGFLTMEEARKLADEVKAFDEYKGK